VSSGTDLADLSALMTAHPQSTRGTAWSQKLIGLPAYVVSLGDLGGPSLADTQRQGAGTRAVDQ